MRINGKGVRYHFDGVRGKVVQIRELVETLDQLFDSFHKMNALSRTMFRTRPDPGREWDRLD